MLRSGTAVALFTLGLLSGCGAQPLPAEATGDCEPIFGWADCDDCDTQDLAARGLASERVGCLSQALRDGPTPARRAQYRAHGQEEAWSLRHRQRAVVGLASLGDEGRSALERARAWDLPPVVVSTLEAALAP